MQYAIRTYGLTKKYKDAAVVDNLGMTVEQGEIYGFLGQNGAGKTTTLRMLTGLIKPTKGTAELFGQTGNTRELFKKIGTMIEYPGFYPNLTGAENLEIHRRMMGIENREYIREALETAGLNMEEIKAKKFKAYSLGMKQRLGLARAILHKPELLILDEPTNGLDPLGIKEMRETLLHLRNEKGITILISSHLLSEIEHLATKIGIIHKGKLLVEMDYRELQKRNRKYVKLQVSDDKKTCFLLEDVLNIRDFDVLEANILRVYEGLDRTTEIAKTLVANQIDLREMAVSSDNLEDFFVQLTEGRHEHS